MLNGKLARRKAYEFVEKKKLDIVWVKQWTNDTKPMCLFNDNSIILLTKCDFDPMGNSQSLYIINYVFTEYDKRRIGSAKQLIDKLKLTGSSYIAFCNNNTSEELFKNSGFTDVGITNNCQAYRYK
jgi:hypothetical protein